MKGWLCPCCGAENPHSVQRCRACGRTAGAGVRARETLCAGAEHLVWEGQSAVDASIVSDPAGTMARTNRFAQRCVCVTASLAVLFGIWTGAWMVQASGIGIVPQRLSSAAGTAAERMTGQARAVIERLLSDCKAAAEQLDAACDDVAGRITSVPPLPLFQALEAAQERADEALTSMEEIGARVETAAGRGAAAWDGAAEYIGGVRPPPLLQELETVQERAWGRVGETADRAQTARWSASDQMDRLSQWTGDALQPGKLQEKAEAALEGLKSLVDWGVE